MAAWRMLKRPPASLTVGDWNARVKASPTEAKACGHLLSSPCTFLPRRLAGFYWRILFLWFHGHWSLSFTGIYWVCRPKSILRLKVSQRLWLVHGLHLGHLHQDLSVYFAFLEELLLYISLKQNCCKKLQLFLVAGKWIF